MNVTRLLSAIDTHFLMCQAPWPIKCCLGSRTNKIELSDLNKVDIFDMSDLSKVDIYLARYQSTK
jgi:hypothetical protein